MIPNHTVHCICDFFSFDKYVSLLDVLRLLKHLGNFSQINISKTHLPLYLKVKTNALFSSIEEVNLHALNLILIIYVIILWLYWIKTHGRKIIITITETFEIILFCLLLNTYIIQLPQILELNTHTYLM